MSYKKTQAIQRNHEINTVKKKEILKKRNHKKGQNGYKEALCKPYGNHKIKTCSRYTKIKGKNQRIHL